MVFQQVMAALWDIMNIPIIIYGFEITMAQIFLFSMITGGIFYALFKIVWG